MVPKKMLIQIACYLTVGLISTVAQAQDSSLKCPSEAEEYSCAIQLRDELEERLQAKVQSLAKKAKSMQVFGASKDVERAQRTQAANAIVEADRAWRLAVKQECEVLLKFSYGSGGGWERGSVECAAKRMKERLAFLADDEVYTWIR